MEILKFITVGGSGLIINNVLLLLFSKYLPLSIAANLAIFLTIFYNFILNDVWTFKNRKKTNGFITRLAKFYISRIVGWIVQYSSLILFISIFPLVIANTIAIFFGFLANYVTSFYWVWK